ncbi:uncharacterized protein LOC143214142 [Lasioglossum baleicum]|uniref:uncharacterized protein LOC143214142 n=1 Tax=Lasioglossum baleicum TaxID=434251 RepID=UPI003FCD39B5
MDENSTGSSIEVLHNWINTSGHRKTRRGLIARQRGSEREKEIVAQGIHRTQLSSDFHIKARSHIRRVLTIIPEQIFNVESLPINRMLSTKAPARWFRAAIRQSRAAVTTEACGRGNAFLSEPTVLIPR